MLEEEKENSNTPFMLDEAYMPFPTETSENLRRWLRSKITLSGRGKTIYVTPDGKCTESMCVNMSETRPCNFPLAYKRVDGSILCDEHWERRKVILGPELLERLESIYAKTH